MGWRNKKDDRNRQGFVASTPLRNMSGRAKDKAMEKLVDYKTGRILVKTTSGTVTGVRGTIRAGSAVWRAAKKFINRSECPICKKKVTPPMDVHPGSCARKMAAKLFNEEANVEKMPTAMEAQEARHAEWNKITGGIQYDDDGKRIW